ncbi:MAG: hypothetical protein LJE91_02660 [Gammaproteobacteria bacterium]|nr:hypothetical protein [Gammaproteobacteria bacterium]
MNSHLSSAPELELVDEAKIRHLLGNPPEKRFEASGVCVKDDVCYVIFDNVSHLACFTLRDGGLTDHSRMIPLHNPFSGYEDIAYDAQAQRFYLLIEAQKAVSGHYMARIEEYDRDLNFLASQWADFPFKHKNKGMEGLACVYLDDKRYLLGLCEGNKCKGGRKGRKPGGGRIQVFFESGQNAWNRVKTLELPESLPFEDYASLDVSGNRIAVVSQASSLLWLGTFKDRDGNFTDDGRVYRFPRTGKQKTRYCNIEGIAWLAPDLILTVSDRRKSGEQAKRCKCKDQSIHTFRIPAA